MNKVIYAFAMLLLLNSCKKGDAPSCNAAGKEVTYEILSITGGCTNASMAQWVNATGNFDYVYSTAQAGFTRTVSIQTPGLGCGVSFLTLGGSGCEITSRILVDGTEVKRGTGNNVTLIYNF